MKIILINGPPRSGKTTLSSLLTDHRENTEELDFAEALRTAINWPVIMEDLRDKGFFESWPYNDKSMYEKMKEFEPDLVRQIMIKFGENLMKPVLGMDFPARYVLTRLYLLRGLNVKYVVISDLGFIEEYKKLKEEYPKDLFIVKISREGCSFREDSRMNLDIPVDYVVRNTSVKELQKSALEIIKKVTVE